MREQYVVPELIEYAALTDVTTGSSATLSDRAAKTNVTQVESREVLQRLATMPISTWRYKKESPHVRHIGPMAQDFKATFEVGGSDKSIAFVDANGVNMAAIQGLYQMLQERDTQIADLRQQIADLTERLDQIDP
jgi:hypothetical protein